jgi:hypothetical protein
MDNNQRYINPEDIKRLKMDIEGYRKMLINKAKNKGIYENFGQREVRLLRDKKNIYLN